MNNPKAPGLNPGNFGKDLSGLDRHDFDRQGGEGPMAHVPKPDPRKRPTKPDQQDLDRMAAEGGKVPD